MVIAASLVEARADLKSAKLTIFSSRRSDASARIQAGDHNTLRCQIDAILPAIVIFFLEVPSINSQFWTLHDRT
jgi:hypothetical protein